MVYLLDQCFVFEPSDPSAETVGNWLPVKACCRRHADGALSSFDTAWPTAPRSLTLLRYSVISSRW